MKHGTNIYITKTVHKKKPNKQTHPQHVYTKTVILLTPNEIYTRQHIIMYKANIFMAIKTQI